jgi:SpoVK/Ycf46/Vps4 family AAA+-type ATPase
MSTTISTSNSTNIFSPEFLQIMTDLTTKAYEYYCKAEIYRKKGELEGALINYLLSTNNLYMVQEGLKKNNKSSRLIFNKISVSNITCEIDTTQENIDTALKRNIKWIIPLQEKLRKIKKNRGSSKEEEDENKVNCENIKIQTLKNCLTFDDIAGQEEAKNQIKKGILYPILNPRLFPITSKGILFYGPPGTGKTLLAKAFVNELQIEANKKGKDIRILFYAPTGASLKGKYVGETEKNISKYFKCASKQAYSCEDAIKNSDGYYYMQKIDPVSNNPLTWTDENNVEQPIMEAVKHKGKKVRDKKTIAVLFIDEIEAIAGSRANDESGMMTNSVNTLLQMMDGIKSFDNVVVMAATNYPWKLDDAIMRRFDSKILVTLPKKKDIIQLIKIEIANYIKKATKIKKQKSGRKQIVMRTICNKDNCNSQNDSENSEKLLEKYKKEKEVEEEKTEKNISKINHLVEQINKLEKYIVGAEKHSENSDNVNVDTYGWPKNTKIPLVEKLKPDKPITDYKYNEKYSGYITPAVCCGDNENENERVCLEFPCVGTKNNGKPVDIFNYFRDTYFPQLTESDLDYIASVYSDPKKPFSGGDVSNACKAVYKKLGDHALKINKWDPKFLENPKKIRPNITQKDLDDEDYMRDEFSDKYQYLLFSERGKGSGYKNLKSESIIILPTNNFYKREINAFDADINISYTSNINTHNRFGNALAESDDILTQKIKADNLIKDTDDASVISVGQFKLGDFVKLTTDITVEVAKKNGITIYNRLYKKQYKFETFPNETIGIIYHIGTNNTGKFILIRTKIGNEYKYISFIPNSYRYIKILPKNYQFGGANIASSEADEKEQNIDTAVSPTNLEVDSATPISSPITNAPSLRRFTDILDDIQAEASSNETTHELHSQVPTVLPTTDSPTLSSTDPTLATDDSATVSPTAVSSTPLTNTSTTTSTSSSTKVVPKKTFKKACESVDNENLKKIRGEDKSEYLKLGRDTTFLRGLNEIIPPEVLKDSSTLNDWLFKNPININGRENIRWWGKATKNWDYNTSISDDYSIGDRVLFNDLSQEDERMDDVLKSSSNRQTSDRRQPPTLIGTVVNKGTPRTSSSTGPRPPTVWKIKRDNKFYTVNPEDIIRKFEDFPRSTAWDIFIDDRKKNWINTFVLWDDFISSDDWINTLLGENYYYNYNIINSSIHPEFKSSAMNAKNAANKILITNNKFEDEFIEILSNKLIMNRIKLKKDQHNFNVGQFICIKGLEPRISTSLANCYRLISQDGKPIQYNHNNLFKISEITKDEIILNIFIDECLLLSYSKFKIKRKAFIKGKGCINKKALHDEYKSKLTKATIKVDRIIGTDDHVIKLGSIIETDKDNKRGYILNEDIKLIPNKDIVLYQEEGSKLFKTGDEITIQGNRYRISNIPTYETECKRELNSWEKDNYIKSEIDKTTHIKVKKRKIKSLLDNISTVVISLDEIAQVYIQPSSIRDIFNNDGSWNSEQSESVLESGKFPIRLLLKITLNLPPQLNNINLDDTIYLRFSIEARLHGTGEWRVLDGVKGGVMMFKSFLSLAYGAIKASYNLVTTGKFTIENRTEWIKLPDNSKKDKKNIYSNLDDNNVMLQQLFRWADRLIVRDERGYMREINNSTDISKIEELEKQIADLAEKSEEKSNEEPTDHKKNLEKEIDIIKSKIKKKLPYYSLSNMRFKSAYYRQWTNGWSGVVNTRFNDFKDCLAANEIADSSQTNPRDCGLGIDITKKIISLCNVSAESGFGKVLGIKDKINDKILYILQQETDLIQSITLLNKINDEGEKKATDDGQPNTEKQKIEEKIAKIKATLREEHDIDITNTIADIKESIKQKRQQYSDELIACTTALEKASDERDEADEAVLTKCNSDYKITANTFEPCNLYKSTNNNFKVHDYKNPIYEEPKNFWNLIDIIREDPSYAKGNSGNYVQINEDIASVEKGPGSITYEWDWDHNNPESKLDTDLSWYPMMIPIYSPGFLKNISKDTVLKGGAAPDIITESCLKSNKLCNAEELLENDGDSRLITFAFNSGYFTRVINPKFDDSIKNTSSELVVKILEKYKRGETLTDDDKKLKTDEKKDK